MALNLADALNSGGLTIDQNQDAAAVAPYIGDPYSSGGTTTTPTYTDPYAQWGGQTAYNNLISGFDTQKGNIISSADEAIGSSANQTRSSVLDFLDQYRGGQAKIDLAGTRNELAKRQGVAGVKGMVGRGIRSGGVTLANKNASDSSAAGAIARAYADIGGREMRNVGNQYEQQNQEIGLQQQDLERQANTFGRHLEENKTNIVNNIVSDVRSKFAALDAEMAQADLPGRIAIEQEKEAVRGRALAQLSQFDAMLRDERAKIRPADADARRARASEMETAGYDLGADAFNFTEQTPMQSQGTGPFASDLPIFTRPRSRQEV